MGEIRNNQAENRYELDEEGVTAFAEYRLRGGRISFTHTLVPKEIEGRGVGSRLVRGALDDVRRRGLKVVPICPFVKAYMERHPEVQDLRA
jgi:predicted GNAT family acetyltransferase